MNKSTTSTKQDLYTTQEITELLRVHRVTAERMARDGELPARKVGGKWLFNGKAVREYLGID